MNNIGALIKYAAKEQFFVFSPKKTVANYPKNYVGRLALIIINYIFLGLLVFFYAGMVATLFAKGDGGEVIYFTMFGVLVTLFIFTMYLPRIMSDFFSPKDIGQYKTLPIGQGELFLGKLFGATIGFVDFLLFLAIYLGIYFNAKGFSISMLIFGLLNFIPLVVIPYGIIAGLMLLVLRFTNLGSHRKLLKTIGYIILFVIIGVIYYFSFQSGAETEQAIDYENAIAGLASVSNAFFNAKLYGLAMSGGVGNQIKYTLILFALAAILSGLLYFLADRFYFDAVSKDSGKAPSKKKKASVSDVSFSPSSPIKAIAKRDFKNLFSNIVFLTQAITFLVIFGVMGATMGSTIMKESVGTDLIGAEVRFWIFMAGFLLSVLIWTATSFATNSLSREHTSFYLFQTLPIKTADHFAARFLSSFVATEIFNLALSIIFTIFIGLGALNGVLLFIGLTLGAIVANLIGLYTGTRNIKTNWKKPEELSKGGVSGLVVYILSFVFIGLMIALYVIIMNLTNGSHNLASLLMLAVILILVFISSNMGYKAYKKGFYDI